LRNQLDQSKEDLEKDYDRIEQSFFIYEEAYRASNPGGEKETLPTDQELNETAGDFKKKMIAE